MSRLSNEHPIIDNVVRQLNQLREVVFTSNIHAMRGRVILLSVLSVLFILFLFFHSFDKSPKPSISVNFKQPNIIKANFTETKVVQNDDDTIIFSKNKYLNRTQKPSENIIAYLVASIVGDTRLGFNPYPRLRERVLQLDERLGDNNLTDVIIFHTGYPLRSDLLPIIEGSRRQVEFVNIDQIFYKFSPGFKPHITDPSWSQKGKWNYHHMCYFWFKQVFELKIMQRYRYMMRLDDDSQILGKWPNVFDLMVKHQALYLANQREVDYEYILPGMSLARNLTAAYIIKNNITVRNPAMIADVFNKTWEIPNYWNNFEVVDLSFMRRKDVAAYIQAIDESKGIFLYRWGDAPLRYMMLAVFTNASEVLHRVKLELGYCHPC